MNDISNLSFQRSSSPAPPPSPPPGSLSFSLFVSFPFSSFPFLPLGNMPRHLIPDRCDGTSASLVCPCPESQHQLTYPLPSFHRTLPVRQLSETTAPMVIPRSLVLRFPFFFLLLLYLSGAERMSRSVSERSFEEDRPAVAPVRRRSAGPSAPVFQVVGGSERNRK
jgi:hypothetical protein